MGILFDGVDDHINLGDIFDSFMIGSSAKFTISLLSKSDDTADYIVMSKYLGGVSRQFRIRSRGTSFQTQLWSTHNDNNTRFEISNVIATTNWVNYVLCIDMTQAGDARFKAYVNGVDNSVKNNIGFGTGMQDIGQNLTIGAASNGATSYKGQITEVVVWDVVLSQQEINQLYNSGRKYMPSQIQQANRAEFWPMDDGQDGISADGDIIRGIWNGNDGVGDDGANNTGLIWKAEEVLSYPSPSILITEAELNIPIFMNNYRRRRI